MKLLSCSRGIVAALAAAVTVLVSAVGHAQPSPPNGTFGPYTINDPSNRVWDISGVIKITEAEVSAHNSDTDVTFEFTTNPLNQNGSGKISAAGSAPTHLTIHDEDGTAEQTFTGDYTVKGSIKGGKGIARGSLTQSVTGMADVEGVRRVSGTHTTQFVIDAVAGTVTVKNTDRVAAAGKGSITNQRDEETNPLSEVFAEDGSWKVEMTLSTTDVTVTGTAIVTLHSGRTFNFTAKGKLNNAVNISQITLKGVDEAKGSTLQVQLQNDSLLAVKGKISGQAVDAAAP